MHPKFRNSRLIHLSLGITRDLDHVSVTSICLSGAVILTTIQAQDFRDTDGDRALGRITFPIYAPGLSRAVTLAALICWSYGLSSFWEIGPALRTAYLALGMMVGFRYYFMRHVEADRFSYVLYNVSPAQPGYDGSSANGTFIPGVANVCPHHARSCTIWRVLRVIRILLRCET